MIKKEIDIFFTALMFYTRIPCPKNINHNPEYLNKASRYFPLIGWIVGGLSFLVFILFQSSLTLPLAVILSIVASVLITGGFHEDGFADVCDGFGGGWTKEKILTIMKDSAIGAYGALGLILILTLKTMAIIGIAEQFQPLENAPWYLFLIFITGHSLSRLAAISIVFTHQYSRDDATSKSKPIAQHFGKKEVLGALFFGLVPLGILCTFYLYFGIALIPVFMTRFFLARYFQKWIDGNTGDCLGATQQVCEIIFYLSTIILWKFI
jgi:adenosylcobinamide-GDP ribazoletransferase